MATCGIGGCLSSLGTVSETRFGDGQLCEPERGHDVGGMPFVATDAEANGRLMSLPRVIVCWFAGLGGLRVRHGLQFEFRFRSPPALSPEHEVCCTLSLAHG